MFSNKNPRSHKGGTRPTPKAQKVRRVLKTVWVSDKAKQKALEKARRGSIQWNCVPRYGTFQGGDEMSTLVKVLGAPAVAALVKRVTGKVLGAPGAVNEKVTAAAWTVMIVELVLQAVKAVDAGLGEILQGHKAAILEVTVMVGVVVAYYTPQEA